MTENTRKTEKSSKAPDAIYAVASVHFLNDGQDGLELVSNAVWYEKLQDAKVAAFERAHSLFSEYVSGQDGRRNAKFDDVWIAVDNGDPEFMDWGFDPVDDIVSCAGIRVFKVYRGE